MQICLNENWRYTRENVKPYAETDGWGGAKARAYDFGAAAIEYDDGQWKVIDVPYDFVLDGTYSEEMADSEMLHIPEMESIKSRHVAGGSLKTGVAWYRKHFKIEKEWEEKRIYLCFDGVYRNCTVYLNQYYVGTHKTGYTPFRFDITDFVHMGADNVLAVRVNASGREGWWYEGGGIYKDVYLDIRDSIHIVHNGVAVTSDIDLEKKCAVVNVKAELLSKTEKADLLIKHTILSPEGREIAETEAFCQVPCYDSAMVCSKIGLEQIVLWEPAHPVLYQIRTELIRDSIVIDTVIQSIGFRTIRFDAQEGFFLNEKKVLIKGVCCHHDHAGVGIGVPASVIEYRLRKIKELGANAYRSSHHMASKEVLEVCDRLGILVFDETRRMSSAGEDIEAVRTMVKTNRNHPSVILWGIGNEEIFSQDRPETMRTTKTLKYEVKKLDPTRSITSAVVCWNGKERFPDARKYVAVTKELDIMGFNYSEGAWADYHQRMPAQPVIITEASTNSGTRGCYSTDPFHAQYYIFDRQNQEKMDGNRKAVKLDMAEREWDEFLKCEFLSGIFVWTGFDYRGEPTPMGYPGISSQFGIYDSCGFEKDNVFYYKAIWSDEEVLHLFPHWTLKDVEKTDIFCFSNLDEAELFVNGISMGRKKISAHNRAVWEDVSYVPGEIRCIGYKNGNAVKEDIRRTTGDMAALRLTVMKNEIYEDAKIILIEAVDQNGQVVPVAEDLLSFELVQCELLGCGNGDPGCHESDRALERHLFHGKAMLLVKPTGEAGQVTVKTEQAGSFCVSI